MENCTEEEGKGDEKLYLEKEEGKGKLLRRGGGGGRKRRWKSILRGE